MGCMIEGVTEKKKKNMDRSMALCLHQRWRYECHQAAYIIHKISKRKVAPKQLGQRERECMNGKEKRVYNKTSQLSHQAVWGDRSGFNRDR